MSCLIEHLMYLSVVNAKHSETAITLGVIFERLLLCKREISALNLAEVASSNHIILHGVFGCFN